MILVAVDVETRVPAVGRLVAEPEGEADDGAVFTATGFAKGTIVFWCGYSELWGERDEEKEDEEDGGHCELIEDQVARERINRLDIIHMI